MKNSYSMVCLFTLVYPSPMSCMRKKNFSFHYWEGSRRRLRHCTSAFWLQNSTFNYVEKLIMMSNTKPNEMARLVMEWVPETRVLGFGSAMEK